MIKAIKDARGRESKTLTFVTISWAALLIKFVFAGLTMPLIGDVPLMTASEFGQAVALVLAIWLGREWTEKSKSNAE
jgi:hypothetical protein